MPTLVTERLTLRPARWDDLDALHRIFIDPRAMRYWSRPTHTDVEETRAWLRSMIEATSERSADFIVELDGRVIGKAGCYRMPEVGYILHPDHWGRGLATEALAAVIDHVFATHDVEALVADVDPRNEASLRLLARLGFEETGRAERTFEIAGEWVDSVYLRLDRPARLNPGEFC